MAQIKAYHWFVCGVGTFLMHLCDLWRWKLLNDNSSSENLM